MPIFGKLIVIRRNGSDGSQFPLTKETCLFGRNADCDIRVQLPFVSNVQCKLTLGENGEFTLHNISETNKTTVNGKSFDGMLTVRNKDVFTIVDRSFRFEYPENSSHLKSVVKKVDSPVIKQKTPLRETQLSSIENKTDSPFGALVHDMKNSLKKMGTPRQQKHISKENGTAIEGSKQAITPKRRSLSKTPTNRKPVTPTPSSQSKTKEEKAVSNDNNDVKQSNTSKADVTEDSVSISQTSFLNSQESLNPIDTGMITISSFSDSQEINPVEEQEKKKTAKRRRSSTRRSSLAASLLSEENQSTPQNSVRCDVQSDPITPQKAEESEEPGAANEDLEEKVKSPQEEAEKFEEDASVAAIDKATVDSLNSSLSQSAPSSLNSSASVDPINIAMCETVIDDLEASKVEEQPQVTASKKRRSQRRSSLAKSQPSRENLQHDQLNPEETTDASITGVNDQTDSINSIAVCMNVHSTNEEAEPEAPVEDANDKMDDEATEQSQTTITPLNSQESLDPINAGMINEDGDSLSNIRSEEQEISPEPPKRRRSSRRLSLIKVQSTDENQASLVCKDNDVISVEEEEDVALQVTPQKGDRKSKLTPVATTPDVPSISLTPVKDDARDTKDKEEIDPYFFPLAEAEEDRAVAKKMRRRSCGSTGMSRKQTLLLFGSPREPKVTPLRSSLGRLKRNSVPLAEDDENSISPVTSISNTYKKHWDPLPEVVEVENNSSPIKKPCLIRLSAAASPLMVDESPSLRPKKTCRVSFGPHLSPEQFLKNFPPNTPIKKGATPSIDDKKQPRKSLALAGTTTLETLEEVADLSPAEKSTTPVTRRKISRTPTPFKPSSSKAKPKPLLQQVLHINMEQQNVNVNEASPVLPSRKRRFTPIKQDDENGAERTVAATEPDGDINKKQKRTSNGNVPIVNRHKTATNLHRRRSRGSIAKPSWCDIVKKPATNKTKPKVIKRKVTEQSKPKSRKIRKKPELLEVNTARHVDSPATIYIGRSRSRLQPTRTPRPPKSIPVTKLNIPSDEDFTGVADMFATPPPCVQSTPSRDEDDLYSSLKTPKSVGEMLVSPLTTPSTGDNSDMSDASSSREDNGSSPDFSRITRKSVSDSNICKSPTDIFKFSYGEDGLVEDGISDASPVLSKPRASKRKERHRRNLDKSEPVKEHFGTKRIFMTPRDPKKSEQVEEHFGTKRMFMTPRDPKKSEQVEEHFGTKRMFMTPRDPKKSEQVEEHFGTKRMFMTPRDPKKSEQVEEHFGTKRMFTTPRDAKKSEPVKEHFGLKRLFHIPKEKMQVSGSSSDDDLFLDNIMGTPEGWVVESIEDTTEQGNGTSDTSTSDGNQQQSGKRSQRVSARNSSAKSTRTTRSRRNVATDGEELIVPNVLESGGKTRGGTRGQRNLSSDDVTSSETTIEEASTQRSGRGRATRSRKVSTSIKEESDVASVPNEKSGGKKKSSRSRNLTSTTPSAEDKTTESHSAAKKQRKTQSAKKTIAEKSTTDTTAVENDLTKGVVMNLQSVLDAAEEEAKSNAEILPVPSALPKQDDKDESQKPAIVPEVKKEVKAARTTRSRRKALPSEEESIPSNEVTRSKPRKNKQTKKANAVMPNNETAQSAAAKQRRTRSVKKNTTKEEQQDVKPGQIGNEKALAVIDQPMKTTESSMPTLADTNKEDVIVEKPVKRSTRKTKKAKPESTIHSNDDLPANESEDTSTTSLQKEEQLEGSRVQRKTVTFHHSVKPCNDEPISTTATKKETRKTKSAPVKGRGRGRARKIEDRIQIEEQPKEDVPIPEAVKEVVISPVQKVTQKPTTLKRTRSTSSTRTVKKSKVDASDESNGNSKENKTPRQPASRGKTKTSAAKEIAPKKVVKKPVQPATVTEPVKTEEPVLRRSSRRKK